MVEESVSGIAVTAAVGAVVLLFVLLCGVFGRKVEEEEEKEQKDEHVANGKKPKQQATKKERSAVKRKEPKHVFSHPWLSTTLKGHGTPVLGLDFSPNGKYLASCGEDRSIYLWGTKQFNVKEHKIIRGNVELDYATKVRFSPDNKSFITSLYRENLIRIFKITKKEDGSTFVQAVHDFPHREEEELKNIGISMSGKFIMTSNTSTIVRVWSLKGEILATINTNQMNTSHASTSPCGRFIATSGFTPDVKVWEVVFDKGGNYKEVTRAFDLKGHTAGVYWFSFSAGSTRMATVSKDSTWKLWDTDIEYQKQQDPKLITSGTYEHSGPAMIALSPDGRTVAIATASDIFLYNGLNGTLEQKFTDVHANAISALEFLPTNSEYFVSAGDKHIHVFHNVPGYRFTIQDLKDKLKSAQNSAYKQRLEEQIKEAQQALKQIGEN